MFNLKKGDYVLANVFDRRDNQGCRVTAVFKINFVSRINEIFYVEDNKYDLVLVKYQDADYGAFNAIRRKINIKEK
jgi:hypothetical protein